MDSDRCQKGDPIRSENWTSLTKCSRWNTFLGVPEEQLQALEERLLNSHAVAVSGGADNNKRQSSSLDAGGQLHSDTATSTSPNLSRDDFTLLESRVSQSDFGMYGKIGGK